MQKTKSKKVKIGFLKEDHDRYKAIESQLFKVLQELEQISKKCLGAETIDNWKLYVDDPKSYLINHYWNLFCDHLPEHLNKENTLQTQTNINLSRVNDLKLDFWNLYDKLNKQKPKIDASGVHSAFKKESFNLYLKESKRDHYKALQDVLNSIETLKKVGGEVRLPIFLHRYIPEILPDQNGLGVILDITNFSE